MLATELEPTLQSFDYYRAQAREQGYEAGTQNIGYLFKVHVDETEELAEAAGRKYVQGPSNPFLEGNQGIVQPFLQNLPGMTQRDALLPTSKVGFAARSRGREAARPGADALGTFEDQINKMSIITGTPKTVIPKVRHVLEYLRPGSIFFWDGDGAMDHDDAMRSLRLMGEELIPAVREIADDLELKSPFEVDPKTGQPVEEQAPAVGD
jgi:alkanesulfonate monooxygenase SsuD/methylene tetrahydromethanopterin reductase-like flavin-dependent oxidoreductase (luciferase family)